MTRVLTVVAAAIYNSDGDILLAQRPLGKSMAGLWEFPGGKLEPGETPEAALTRELDEELGLKIEEKHLIPSNFTSHAYKDFHLLMPLFACSQWTGTPIPREGQRLAWVKPAKLHDYPAPAADLPLFDYLANKTG